MAVSFNSPLGAASAYAPRRPVLNSRQAAGPMDSLPRASPGDATFLPTRWLLSRFLAGPQASCGLAGGVDVPVDDMGREPNVSQQDRLPQDTQCCGNYQHTTRTVSIGGSQAPGRGVPSSRPPTVC